MICAVRRKRILKSEILLYKFVVYSHLTEGREESFTNYGDAMVSTGVLKVGIAIRGSVNRVIKLEPFLKRNDKNNFALAA